MRKFPFYIVIVLLTFLPFQPFLVTWSGGMFFSVLRDLLVILIFILAVIARFKDKKPLISDHFEWLLFLLLLWTILSYLLIGKNLAVFLFSLRYSFGWLAIFWAVRSFDFSEKQVKPIIKTILFIFGIIFIIGILHALVLPKDFFLKFGYSDSVAIGNGIWQTDANLPAAQVIPGGLVRAQSTLSGPVQLAAYLLIILGLFLTFWRTRKNQILIGLIGIASLSLLILTFTRSAWIGLFFMILALAILPSVIPTKVGIQTSVLSKVKAKIWIPVFTGMTIAGVIFLSTNFGQKFVTNSIIRQDSTAEHQSSITRIFKQIPQIGFWGRGIGFSGPASLRSESIKPRAVENSLLRIYEELGIPGLILFLYLIFLLIIKSLTELENNNPIEMLQQASGLALIGILVNSLFSDTFSEVIPMIYLGIILGLGLKKVGLNEHTHRYSLLNVPIDALDQSGTLEAIDQMVKSQKPHQICTVNAEFIVESQKNPQFKKALQTSDLNTVDGSGIIAAVEFRKKKEERRKKKAQTIFYLLSSIFYLVSGFLTGLRLILAQRSFEKIPDRVTGADLTQKLCHDEKYRIYFLGGFKESEKTKNELKRIFPDLKISGVEYGGKILADGTPEDQKLIGRIAKSKTDILLVGFPSPRQELLLNRYKNQLNIPVMIGVGGSIDFLVGLQKRAPKIFQTFSMEWLWRLITNISNRSRRQRIFNAVIKFPWLIYKSQIKSLS